MPKPTNGTAPTRPRYLRVLGWLVVAAALFYFGQRLVANYDAFSAFRPTVSGLVILVACAAGYAAAQVPLALVWGRLAGPPAAGAGAPRLWQTVSIYGRSQFAKYLPGNIFHYAGRQVLGRGFGWSQSGMALASAIEVSLVVAAAATLILAYGMFVENDFFLLVPKPLVAAGLVICLAAPWGLIRLAPRLQLTRSLISKTQSGRLLRGPPLPTAFAVYLLFFMAAGALAWVTLLALDPTTTVSLLPVVAAGFVSSWLVGYMTPGASAGLGVREAALTILLGGLLGEPQAIALALALRLVTSLGDLFNFAGSLIVHRVFGGGGKASA